MKRYKFITATGVLFCICAIIIFTSGEVTINIKDAISNKYIKGIGINIKPNLNGIAGPGTDAGGPIVYKLHIPNKYKIFITSRGYKDKSLNLTLVPFREYTIYLEPNL